MHAPPPSSYKNAKHQTPFILVLLQTRSPSRCSKAVPAFLSHTVIFHHMQNLKLFFFVFFFVKLTPHQDGLMTFVSELVFRRSLSVGKCVGERENVVAEMEL
jgi:hypothetical protein